MDLFYLGDVLRGLNCSPTLAKIESLGGTKKKGEKYITLEEFYPLYSNVKAALKDMGSFEDFVECCKLYDKQENGTMMLGELEHILLNLGKISENSSLIQIRRISKFSISDMQPISKIVKTGEKLEREDVDTLLKECADEEDADGFIPYERKFIYNTL